MRFAFLLAGACAAALFCGSPSIAQPLNYGSVAGGAGGSGSCTGSFCTATAPLAPSLGGTGQTSQGTGVGAALTNSLDAAGGLCSVGGSGCPGGGSGTVTGVTGGSGVVCNPTTITTTGTCAVTTPNNAFSANHTVAATDMAGTMSLTGSATLTIPAISSTVFAANMTSCYSNTGTGTWTISSTPTLNGLPSTSLVPGAGGCFVSNGTSLDWQPGASLPSTTKLGGVLSGALAAHNFANNISTTTGALTGAQPVVGDLANVAANTVIGNFTGSSAAPAANTVNGGSSCGDGTHALNYTNGTGIGCQTLSGGGGSGGGTSGWSGLPLTFATTTTQFSPYAGGGLPSATETAVSTKASGAATISKLHVTLDAALGASATLQVTLEDGTANPAALTCTTASGGASCDDITHSVNVVDQDLLSWRLVSSGAVTAGLPQIKISYAVGTSSVGVTSVTCNAVAITSTGTCPFYQFGGGNGANIAASNVRIVSPIGGSGTDCAVGSATSILACSQKSTAHGFNLTNLIVNITTAAATGTVPVSIATYPGSGTTLTDTLLKCTISIGANTCSDTSDTGVITAGQYWVVKLDNTNNTAGTSIWSYSFDMVPN